MRNKIKIGFSGPTDMLRFKNLAKVRTKIIEKKGKHVKKDVTGFTINEMAGALHPSYIDMVIEDITEHPATNSKTPVAMQEIKNTAQGHFFTHRVVTKIKSAPYA